MTWWLVSIAIMSLHFGSSIAQSHLQSLRRILILFSCFFFFPFLLLVGGVLHHVSLVQWRKKKWWGKWFCISVFFIFVLVNVVVVVVYFYSFHAFSCWFIQHFECSTFGSKQIFFIHCQKLKKNTHIRENEGVKQEKWQHKNNNRIKKKYENGKSITNINPRDDECVLLCFTKSSYFMSFRYRATLFGTAFI